MASDILIYSLSVSLSICTVLWSSLLSSFTLAFVFVNYSMHHVVLAGVYARVRAVLASIIVLCM
jgi:hypothetical protein